MKIACISYRSWAITIYNDLKKKLETNLRSVVM